MGKYDVKKKKKKKSSQLPVWLIGICCIALPVAVIAISWSLRSQPVKTPTPSTPTVPSAPTVLVPTFPTVPDGTTTPNEPVQEYPYLGADLSIDYIGSYAGIYMEDGTDDIVSDLLMLIVQNTGSQDLQLARITLQYSDFLADFELTNLPVGEKVVLLERNRHEYVNEMPIAGLAKDLVFFPESMDLQEDIVSVSGGDGYVDVTNVSGQDLTGDVIIYYKNSSSDLLYGGITYRVRVSDGIPAGETVRIMSKHYHPDRCSIVMVSYIG